MAATCNLGAQAVVTCDIGLGLAVQGQCLWSIQWWPTDHLAVARSPALRLSLKRGLARQAIAMAERDAPNLPGLFWLAAGLRPNAKAVERLALQLKVRPGVTRVSMARNGKALG
jgi:hypothetical protein